MTQGIVRASAGKTSSRAGEWIWGGVGVGAASLSACFAAYMMAFGPTETKGRALAEYGTFAPAGPSARMARNYTDPILADAPRSAKAADERQTAAAPGPVDFDPTGTLLETPAGGKGSGSDTLLSAFILRDVFDGRALVETPTSMRLVSKGSVIAGAGEVLSIERRGGQWAVVTSKGVIGGPK